jgi:hypothetical protein
MRRITTLVAAFAVLLFTVASFSGVARAQYPTPSGNLTVGVSQTTAGLGQTVTVTATLRDVNGAVLASHSCVLSVVSQPGTDASVAPSSANTDANGSVTAPVNVGTTPGTIVVRVTCGSVTSTVGVVAGAAVTSGQPPASSVELPNTGSGAMAGSGESDTTMLLGSAVLMLVLGSIALRSRRPRG